MAPRARDDDVEVGDAPTSINPYEVLAIASDATQEQIKSAYRRAALKHHPDKASAEAKAAAHTKFQEIAFAYAILSDERRRRRYDATGSTSESLDLDDDDFDWSVFYQEQFEGAVTDESIDRFADEYRGSEEEKGHVLAAYERYKGNMGKLYEDVMLSDMVEDEERFRTIIDKAIADGEVDAHAKYTDESEKSRRNRIERERKRKEKSAKEAEKAAKEMDEDPKSKKNRSKAKSGNADVGDLAALIQQRQKGREADFFGRLEEKYASSGTTGKARKGGAKRPAMDEPPEEAFEKNRKAGKTTNEHAAESVKKGKRSKRS